MMYWRQPAAQRTMKTYLALSEAVRAELNPTDSRVHRWSAEERASQERQRGGRDVRLPHRRGRRDEVFTCTLVDHPRNAKELSSAPTAQPNERQVVVLRKEREVMEGTTRVKDELARCKTHTVAQQRRGRRRVVVRRLRREDRAGGERAGDVRRGWCARSSTHRFVTSTSRIVIGRVRGGDWGVSATRGGRQRWRRCARARQHGGVRGGVRTGERAVR